MPNKTLHEKRILNEINSINSMPEDTLALIREEFIE